MKYRIYRTLVFVLLSAGWSCTGPHYTHYANHHTQTHHKSAGTSYKPNPARQTTQVTQNTKKTEQKVPVQNTVKTAPASPVVSQSVDNAKLQQITAVLIAGDVDGQTGEHTKRYVEGLREVSKYLKSQGVKVHEYFCPADDWQHIITLSPQILIYSGHGVYDGSMPPKWVGGFCLTNKFVSSLDIQQQMNLAPNALVLFNHACFSAGSSAGDTGDIGQREAHRRVAMYAHPFIDKGAGCYYANNFDNSLVEVLTKFFSGSPIGDIYKDTAGSWSKILETRSYDFNPSYQIGISRFGEKSYDVAFVGKPNLTVHELVK